MNNFLSADPIILDFHRDVDVYATLVNNSIATAYDDRSPNPLAGGALYAITADILGIHRAILILCEEGIAQLLDSQQRKAKDFIFRDRLWSYWYCPEYRKPKEILENLFSPDMRYLYEMYSGGSHGGYLGLMPWRYVVTTNEIKSFLLWCVGLNYAVLFIWSGVFVFAHDWMYGIHTRWFKLSVETFDALHYAGLSVYKIGIILLNLVPLVALSLVS